MSMFIPEGSSQAQPQGGVTAITPSSPETTTEDIALMQRVLAAAARNSNLIPSDFMAYLVDYMQTVRLEIPIGQVFGFAQFTATTDVVSPSETRTSSSFGDLATVGPQLNGLGDGYYAVIWGAGMAGSPGVSDAEMAISMNGGTAPEGDHGLVAVTSVGSTTSVMCADTFRLSNGGANSLVAKYSSSDGSFACSFQSRFLIALRYANL